MKPSKQDEKGELYRTYIKTSAVGLELTLSVGVGMLVGYFVDRHFKSAPIGLIVGFILGAAAAARRLIAFSRAYVQKNADDAADAARPPAIRAHAKPEQNKTGLPGRPEGSADGDHAPGAGELVGQTKHLGQVKKAKDKYDVQ